MLACVEGVATGDSDRLTLPESGDSNVEFQQGTDQPEAAPSDVLQVFVGRAGLCCEGRSAMAGRYRVDGRRVIFDPAFRLVEGQTYTVVTRGRNTDGRLTSTLSEFSVQPAAEPVVPRVVAIYPGGGALPENILRFYIHFSTPMEAHLSDRFVALVDSEGEIDDAAFMTFKQELWSEDRRRLTVLLDPGRIKRGVAQNLSLGPALEEGRKYSIVVKKDWPSASGVATSTSFEQSFQVTPALRSRPGTNRWELSQVRRKTHDVLSITFDRPFDRALASRLINVFDPNGVRIEGVVSIGADGKSLQFVPSEVWSTDEIEIVVDSRLEDVAGNNFQELLDHKLGERPGTHEPEIITLRLGPPPGKT